MPMFSLSALALAAFLSAQTVDVGTSCHAFRHGYHETNKLTGTQGSCGVIAAESVAIDVAGLWLTRHHPRMRLVLLTVGTAVEVKAVVHNVREVK